MPCRTDYMEPTALEQEAGRLKLLLDEMNGVKIVDPDAYRSAYTYNVTKPEVDAMTADLCNKLQNDPHITGRSLEVQMWWRDHQAADMRRIQAEMDRQQNDADRAAAIAKLSPHERKLLGLS